MTEKDSARILVREALKTFKFEGVEVVVRINPVDTMFASKDIEEVVKSDRLDMILVPKATEADIKYVSEKLDILEEKYGYEKNKIDLFVLVESAYGVENVYNIIQASERVQGVLLGAEDLAADLGIERTKTGEEITYARTKVITACRAMKIAAIDTPFTDTEDTEGLRADTQKAKSLGMTGKSLINPRQVDDVHDVYAPTQEGIEHAKKVMSAKEEADEKGLGVFSVEGKMVDAPIINRAKAVLELAERIGL